MSQATAYLDQAIGSADLQRLRRRAIVSCAVGNFVELFDFVIFGLFATQIGANFFPNVDPVLSLLQSFATYGVGFFMRPVGAIVIGALGDLKGRKIALVLTVGLMATATAITGLIPPYASIGIAAPILLVLCRLLQGFSTGGEWGGAAAFLVEYAPPGKRGLIGSMQQFSVGLGLIMGTLSAYLLNTFLDKEAMIAWGWRVPFILGFLLAPIGFYLRSRVAESPAFDRAVAQHNVASSPVRDSLTLYARPVAAAFGLSIVGTIGNYIFNIFLPSFASGQLGIPASTAYLSTTLAAVILTVLTPFLGALSDKVGRKPILLVSALGYAVLSYPLFLLLTEMRERHRAHAHARHLGGAARHVCRAALRGAERAFPDQGALHGAVDRLQPRRYPLRRLRALHRDLPDPADRQPALAFGLHRVRRGDLGRNAHLHQGSDECSARLRRDPSPPPAARSRSGFPAPAIR